MTVSTIRLALSLILRGKAMSAENEADVNQSTGDRLAHDVHHRQRSLRRITSASAHRFKIWRLSGYRRVQVTLFSVIYIVSAPIFGHVSDRIGRRRILVICLGVFAGANVFTAAAGNFILLLGADFWRAGRQPGCHHRFTHLLVAALQSPNAVCICRLLCLDY